MKHFISNLKEASSEIPAQSEQAKLVRIEAYKPVNNYYKHKESGKLYFFLTEFCGVEVCGDLYESTNFKKLPSCKNKDIWVKYNAIEEENND